MSGSWADDLARAGESAWAAKGEPVTVREGASAFTAAAARRALLSLAAEIEALNDWPRLESITEETHQYARGVIQGIAEMARMQAQQGQGSPSGSPGLSQDTREGQERTGDPGASGEALGVILAASRARLGWSLRDAERATGIPNAHLSQIETGKIASPSLVVLVKLAKAYGMPLRRLIEAAGQGSDWALVEEASEAEIRAAERERIAQLAEERRATYDLTKPCGCGRTHPGTGRPCTALIRSGQPFADLIRRLADE